MTDAQSVRSAASATVSQFDVASAIVQNNTSEEGSDIDDSQSVTPSLQSLGSYFIIRNNQLSLAEAQKLLNKSKSKVVLLSSLLILVNTKSSMVVPEESQKQRPLG